MAPFNLGRSVSTHSPYHGRLREGSGWSVSLRRERLGESPHSRIMREIIPGDCLTEVDGEAEFENWGCEGTRELSGEEKSRKLTSLPGFPYLHTR